MDMDMIMNLEMIMTMDVIMGMDMIMIMGMMTTTMGMGMRSRGCWQTATVRAEASPLAFL